MFRCFIALEFLDFLFIIFSNGSMYFILFFLISLIVLILLLDFECPIWFDNGVFTEFDGILCTIK